MTFLKSPGRGVATPRVTTRGGPQSAVLYPNRRESDDRVCVFHAPTSQVSRLGSSEHPPDNCPTPFSRGDADGKHMAHVCGFVSKRPRTVLTMLATSHEHIDLAIRNAKPCRLSHSLTSEKVRGMRASDA
jgi:hypothetical protein